MILTREEVETKTRETISLIIDRLKMVGIHGVNTGPTMNCLIFEYGDIKNIFISVEPMRNSYPGKMTYTGMQIKIHGFWSTAGKTKNVFFRLRKDGTFDLSRFFEAIKNRIKVVSTIVSDSNKMKAKEEKATKIKNKMCKEFPEAGKYVYIKRQSSTEGEPLFNFNIDAICEEKLRKILPAIEAMFNP